MVIKNRRTPWSYKKSFSIIHKLPAGFKMGFLLILSLSAFIPGSSFRSIILLSIIAIVLILLSLMAKLSPFSLFRGSRPLILIIFAVFLFSGLNFSPFEIKTDGLIDTVIFCIRIGLSFAAGSLLFSVTTAGEIRKSLSKLESFLHLGKFNLGLSISLMLAFLPSFFVIWEDLNLAWKSRCGKNSLKRLVKLTPLLVERMLTSAAEKAVIMEARGMEL
ncbi:MAG: CbiQ family ECF transporter T component [Treponema sp.]|nr:CbiQ family ECF transporter T component [Treponema sp.]